MNQTSEWPEEVYGLGNRKRCRLPIRLSGGVFGQPVAGKPHFRERLLSKGNQATRKHDFSQAFSNFSPFLTGQLVVFSPHRGELTAAAFLFVSCLLP